MKGRFVVARQDQSLSDRLCPAVSPGGMRQDSTIHMSRLSLRERQHMETTPALTSTNRSVALSSSLRSLGLAITSLRRAQEKTVQ